MTGPAFSAEDFQQADSSDAAYDNVAAQLRENVQQRLDRQQVELESRPQAAAGRSIGDFFSALMPDRNTLPKYGRAIARGVVNAGREAANTLNAIGEATGAVSKPDDFVRHWYNTDIIDSKPMTDGEVEGLLGKREDGMAGFVESATQFATGMAVAGELLKPVQILSKANTLRNALAGATADMTVFDPYQARLSNLVKDSPFSNELTNLLASDKNDSELVARLKAGTEGLITGYTLDKFIGGIKALRALKSAKSEEEKAAALALADVQHDPAVHGPAYVKPQEDGTFAVTTREGERRQSMRRATDANIIPTKESLTAARKAESPEIDFFSKRMTYDEFHAKYPALTTTREEWDAEVSRIAASKGVDGPVESVIFKSAADAEGVAASANQAILNAAQPTGKLTAGQTVALSDYANQLAAEGMPTWIHPDFNFNYSASPVEVKATIQAMSELMPRPATVQTHAQTIALADDLFSDKSGEQIIRMLRDKNVATGDMPQYIQAARTYLYSTAAKVSQLAKAADMQPNNGIAFNELKKAMEHLYEVHESAAGLSKTAGRSLDAHKIIVGAENIPEEGRAALEAASTSDARSQLGSLSKADLLATARLIRMSEGDPNAILEMIRGQKVLTAAKEQLSGISRVVDKVNGARMEAMLSGPRTHLVNAFSNAMSAVQMSAEMWWAGVTSGNKALRQQGSDQLLGLFLESRDAWRAAAKAFRTGVNELDSGAALIQDAGAGANNPLSGLSKIAHLPSRMLMTSDEFFKTLNYRASVRGQSLRLARADGITDAAQLAGRLADDMKAAFNLEGAATNPKALQWARTATFQNPLEYGFGKSWQEMVVKHPMLRFVTPFVRTPVNISRYVWDRTPGLNAFRQEFRDDIAAGGERAALAMAKMQSGLAVWTGAALLAHNKVITGSGPKEPRLRAQWLAAGNQPYSVKIPGKGWVSFARANPSLSALGIVADLFAMSGELRDDTIRENAGAFAAAIASNITNQTFMQGVSNTLDAISSGDRHQMLRLFDNTVGSFVPNVLKQVNPDDTLRETRDMVDELMNRLPGFSTELEPRRNIFGEPIVKPPGYINATLNPFTFMADPGEHDVQQKLIELGKAMSMPSEVQGNVKLTDRDLYDNGTHQSPYDRMLELVSKNGLRAELTRKVQSSEWDNYSDGTEAFPGGRKFFEASQIISKHQDQAFQQVLREYPKLKTALHQDKLDKRAAMRGTPSPIKQAESLFQ